MKTSRHRLARLLSGTASILLLAFAPAGAAASNATIKQTTRAVGPTITSDEGAILSAEGQYARTKDAAPVRSAIQHEISDLTALRNRLASQSASSARGKRGKAALIRGISLITKAYRQLDRVFANAGKNLQATKRGAKQVLKNVRRGRAQIRLGAKLLR